jgi:hypothetical protein
MTNAGALRMPSTSLPPRVLSRGGKYFFQVSIPASRTHTHAAWRGLKRPRPSHARIALFGERSCMRRGQSVTSCRREWATLALFTPLQRKAYKKHSSSMLATSTPSASSAHSEIPSKPSPPQPVPTRRAQNNASHPNFKLFKH